MNIKKFYVRIIMRGCIAIFIILLGVILWSYRNDIEAALTGRPPETAKSVRESRILPDPDADSLSEPLSLDELDPSDPAVQPEEDQAELEALPESEQTDQPTDPDSTQNSDPNTSTSTTNPSESQAVAVSQSTNNNNNTNSTSPTNATNSTQSGSNPSSPNQNTTADTETEEKDSETNDWDSKITIDYYWSLLRSEEGYYTARLASMAQSAKAEFRALPQEQQTTSAKTKIVQGYSGRLSALESECDAKVSSLLNELSNELSEHGESSADIIAQMRRYYIGRKADLEADYMSKF